MSEKKQSNSDKSDGRQECQLWLRKQQPGRGQQQKKKDPKRFRSWNLVLTTTLLNLKKH
jgi:hypothetical protein